MSQAGCREHAERLISPPDHSPAQRLRHLDFLAIHLQVVQLPEVRFLQAVEDFFGVAARERHAEGHGMEKHRITERLGLEGALKPAQFPSPVPRADTPAVPGPARPYLR